MIVLSDIVNKIHNPMQDYEKNIEEVKNIVSEIKERWEKCESNGEEADIAVLFQEKKKQEVYDMLSISLILKKILDVYPLEKNQMFNVDEIYIYDKDFEKMEKYDKELLTIFNEDHLTEKAINMQLGMMYLNQGYKTSSHAEEGFVMLMKDFIVEKD